MVASNAGSAASSAGGARAAGGVEFQAEVFAWWAAHAVGDRAPGLGLDSSVRIEAVGCETGLKVDDVGVVLTGGGYVLVQAKGSLRRLDTRADDLRAAVRQVVAAAKAGLPEHGVERPLDPARDRMVIATNQRGSEAFVRLGKVCDRLRELPTALPLDDAAKNEGESVAFRAFRTVVEFCWVELVGSAPTEDELRELFRVVAVRRFDFDPNSGADRIRAKCMLEVAEVSEPFDTLTKVGLQAAREQSWLQRRSLMAKVKVSSNSQDSGATVADLLRAQVADAHNRLLRNWASSTSPSADTELSSFYSATLTYLGFRSALERKRHLLVTGIAGVGKTTLAIAATSTMCQDLLTWDASPSSKTWVPVYVPARLMTGGGSFPRIVATALEKHLRGLFTIAPTKELFETAPDGYQGWLFVIDGADELVRAEDRQDLVKMLNHHIKEDSPYRFVVLCRENSEAASLRGNGSFSSYELTPLNEWELMTFCRVRLHSYPNVSVIDLLEEARHRGIHDLLATPLLAVMACRIYATKGALPATIIDLYEEFIEQLLYGRREHVNLREYLFTAFGKNESGKRFARWMHDILPHMCAYIADKWMLRIVDPQGATVTDIAASFVQERFPKFRPRSDFADHLETVLLETGLFVRQGAELIFVHRALCEYLASTLPDYEDDSFDTYMGGPEERYLGEIELMYGIAHDTRNYANLRVLVAARHDPENFTTIIANLLDSDEVARQFYGADLLSKSDVNISARMEEQLKQFFNRSYLSLSDRGDLEQKTQTYASMLTWFYDELDVEIASILGRLATKSQSIAKFLGEWIEADWLYYRARLEGLIWAERISRGSVAGHLDALTAHDDPMRWLDAAYVYLSVGDTHKALGLAHRPMVTAVQLWRSAEIIYKCGNTGEALEYLRKAIGASEYWDISAAVARMMSFFGADTEGHDLLREQMSVETEPKKEIVNCIDNLGFGGLVSELWKPPSEWRHESGIGDAIEFHLQLTRDRHFDLGEAPFIESEANPRRPRKLPTHTSPTEYQPPT